MSKEIVKKPTASKATVAPGPDAKESPVKESAPVLNTEIQNQRLLRLREKIEEADRRPRYKTDEAGHVAIPASEDTFDDYLAQSEATATCSQELQNFFTNSLANIREMPTSTFLIAGMTFLHGMKPTDVAETMLLSQMFMAHDFAMQFGARMSHCDNMEINEQYTARISKMTALFRENLEALNKHRGKGQQKVTVEHVTVNEGGQAIVGHVEGGRGRGKRK